ncbi:MAG: Asp-tRNA(Asn)/Glu-tRNA(Gln) amidotransferase subunit GatC [Chloroflexaceae bacterium]|nr:Asp-tRNA(Asn)/Glu-tRNA(Gln) amidotransferase subunit GatC [Chloroflexaceae bacterium]
MTLTPAEVEHVAQLARLKLSPEELEQMRVQLSSILDYIASLQEVSIEGVPPTEQMSNLSTVMRSDEVLPPLPHREALANAPDQRDGMFRVRAIFDDQAE